MNREEVKKYIATQLLDVYKQKFDFKDLKEEITYDFTEELNSSLFKSRDFSMSVIELEELNFVKINYTPIAGEYRYIVKLLRDNVFSLYRHFNINIPCEIKDKLVEKISSLKQTSNYAWIEKYIAENQKILEVDSRISDKFGRGDKMFSLLIDTMRGIIDTNGEDISQRIFSKRYLEIVKLLKEIFKRD